VIHSKLLILEVEVKLLLKEIRLEQKMELKILVVMKYLKIIVNLLLINNKINFLKL
jgi:hypothetical protein